MRNRLGLLQDDKNKDSRHVLNVLNSSNDYKLIFKKIRFRSQKICPQYARTPDSFAHNSRKVVQQAEK